MDPKNNIVFIHCQENMSRSVIFLVAYLCLTRVAEDAASALSIVLEKLQMSVSKKKNMKVGDIE